MGKNSILIAAAVLVVVISQSFFMVTEFEHGLLFQFGEIRRGDYEPGLHFKLPVVNNVRTFERRIMTINNPTEEFLTNEKKNLFVDFFVKWRIVDAEAYYRATAGNEASGRQRILEIIKDGIRGEFAKRTVQEVVSAERSELMDTMLTQADRMAANLGIDVVDVRVKRLDLPDGVSDSVFNRMRQERARFASQLRAEGAEEGERIRADADRQRTILLAEAYRDAQQIRGEGDALAAEIYANAYEQNDEFYSFHRSMQAYRAALGRQQDILVLTPDSDFFKYLNDATPSAVPAR